MTARILFLALLSVFATSTRQHAQMRVRSDLVSSSKVARADSGKPRLQLVAEIIKETYCEGPDPDLIPLRLLLQLSFTNVGTQKLILERGSKSVPVIRVSKTAEDAIANRFETTINNYIITGNSKGPKVLKRPPLSSFAILAPGQTYKTITEVSVSVPRADPVPAIKINSGSHYIQVGVWTWDESQREAHVRRKAWQGEGFLWSESVFSKPMLFIVRSQPKPADCRCDNSDITENGAIDIATKRMKASGRILGSYKSVAVRQGCEWQVVFESNVKEPDKPSFIFVIDKSSGKILGEFQ